MKHKHYCKHCDLEISPADLRLGIGFAYHERCYVKFYGRFSD